MNPIPVLTRGGAATFAVRVVPRAGRTELAGTRGDALLVCLAAAPVDGAANEALIAFLSGLLQRPKRDLAIVAGAASRDKRIAVAGLPAEALVARLSDILQR